VGVLALGGEKWTIGTWEQNQKNIDSTAFPDHDEKSERLMTHSDLVTITISRGDEKSSLIAQWLT
jgi:hypothetical protein